MRFVGFATRNVIPPGLQQKTDNTVFFTPFLFQCCHNVVAEFIDAHDGTIYAANRPQGGACVTFTLPSGTPPTVEEERAT
ncbi:MAG: hypothetical protein ACYCTY_06115 [Sulfuricella sp.]